MAQLKGNRGCQDCGLYRSAETVCLMGRGPIPAEIMVIMDAPGDREDSQGKPLVGRGKDLLDEMLSQSGVDPKKVFFTNAVKCRTPEGRAPKAAELKACRSHLEREIEAVKPKYIITMGGTALKVIGKGKITEVHGQIIEDEKGRKFMPTFNPWIAFRDPKRAEPLRADLQRFSRMLKGEVLELPKLNLQVVNTFEKFNEFLGSISDEDVVSFDLETTGLDRYNGLVNCIGFGLEQSAWILPLNFKGSPWKGKYAIQRQMVELVSEALEGKKVITHNGKFDNLWLRKHYNVRFPVTFDTMMAAYAINENTPNGLKYLSRVYCGAPEYDISTEAKKGNDVDAKKFYLYCGYDVYYTRKLYYILRKELQKDGPTLKVFKHLLMPAFQAYENMEERGVYINQEKFDIVERELKGRLEAVTKKLKKYADINWGSTQQVGRFIYGQLKLPVIEKTKTGNAGTGESVLLRLQDKHPCIPLLLEFRGLKQQISFFIDGWKKWIAEGHLHPSFKLHVVVTGRTSCSDPNLQQTPRDPVIRSLVGAPPGWTHVQADYSQVELRVVAVESGDPTMRFIFQTGQDIHTKTAQDLTGKEKPGKEERKQAKAVNFGFVYGMGWKKFKDYARDKYGVHLTDDQAKYFRKRFFESYNTLTKWHDRQRRLVRINGYVRNRIGRLRRLPEINSPDEKVQAEAERQSINSPVQSLASDITLMAIIDFELGRLDGTEVLDPDEAFCYGSVHDAILFRVRNDCLDKYLPIIKETMESPSRLSGVFNLELPVPIVADVDVGDWGNGEEVDFDKLAAGEISFNR